MLLLVWLLALLTYLWLWIIWESGIYGLRVVRLTRICTVAADVWRFSRALRLIRLSFVAVIQRHRHRRGNRGNILISLGGRRRIAPVKVVYERLTGKRHLRELLGLLRGTHRVTLGWRHVGIGRITWIDWHWHGELRKTLGHDWCLSRWLLTILLSHLLLEHHLVGLLLLKNLI